MTNTDRPIVVLGAGAWGTALANSFAHKGYEVFLIDHNAERAQLAEASRENSRFLPGIKLSPNVRVTFETSALSNASAILAAVPAQQMRKTLKTVAAQILFGTPLIICAKGIERDTGHFISEVAAQEVPGAIAAVLSGPSFADDVARGLPTAVILACHNQSIATVLANDLSSSTLRIYHGSDMRGVEIGGAAKNVLAIACGIVQGRKLGESARAALIARGFAEISRFARALGARPETLMGLSGLGDTVLTCSSTQSRNFAFGDALGRGVSPAEAAGGKLTEGTLTASALITKAHAVGVEMPVCEAVDAVIAGKISIEQVTEALMNRPIKPEAI